MANTIAWSYDLLSQPEQLLFRRLAVFVGGFDLVAAETVACPDGTPGAAAFEGVASLVEHSLLHQVPEPGGDPRYAMLETVREFALERLADSGEMDAVRAAHAAYFLALAERLIPEAPGASIVPWIAVIEGEHPNLRVALAWLGDTPDAEAFLRLATRLWQFWYYKGHLGEGRQWLEHAVARMDGAAATLRVKALHHAGQLAHYQGDDERAIPLLREALARSRRLDRSWLLPHTLLTLGVVEEDRGEYELAESLLRQALTLYREWGEPIQLAITTCHLGVVAYGRGELGTAAEVCAEALAIARSVNDPYSSVEALWVLGSIASEQGDRASAAAYFNEVLELVEIHRDRGGIVHSLACVGVHGVRCGHAEPATRLLGAAAAFREAIGLLAFLPERGKYEQAAVTARVALGEAAFVAAWSAGRALSMDQAIASAQDLVGALPPAAVPSVAAPPAAGRLTPRELEVLRLLVEGRTDKEIGTALHLSPRTVMRHVTGILTKLGAENRTAASHYALRHGLV
jgi:non-specific serine/threonine protein kinase